MSTSNGKVIDFVIGSMAGFTGKIVEYPFDTIKVRLQSQPFTHHYGALDCLKKTIQQEGYLGLYQGLSSPLFGCMIETALIFSLYQSCKSQFNNDSMTHVMLSGLMAGCAVSFVLTPIELIKCRLQTQYLSNEKVKGPRQLIRNVLKKDGILGMYKGHGANCLREGLGGGVWFGVYEGIKRLSNEPLSPLEIAAAGALSGMAYNGSMFPVDVIKSRQQTIGGSFLQVAKQVWQGAGFKGFYRGLGITLFRSAPSSGSMFLVYVIHSIIHWIGTIVKKHSKLNFIHPKNGHRKKSRVSMIH